MRIRRFFLLHSFLVLVALLASSLASAQTNFMELLVAFKSPLPAATQKALHDLGTFTGKEGATPFFKLRLKNGSDPAKVKLALRKEPGILYVFDGDAAKVDRGSARSVKEHVAFLEALKTMAKPTDKPVKGIMAMSEGDESASILKKKMPMMMGCLGFGRPTPTSFKTA